MSKTQILRLHYAPLRMTAAMVGCPNIVGIYLPKQLDESPIAHCRIEQPQAERRLAELQETLPGWMQAPQHWAPARELRQEEPAE
jgi:hypothetical protein